MLNRGWRVVTVDNEPKFNPDYIADVCTWSWEGERPDLIWASPPCVEFARESMPWCRTGQKPDLSVWEGCQRIINESQPMYWIIENVRGAMPWFGKPREIHGAFYLWGFFPLLGNVDLSGVRKKESYYSKDRELRAKIPEQLSLAVARAVELQMSFEHAQEKESTDL